MQAQPQVIGKFKVTHHTVTDFGQFGKSTKVHLSAEYDPSVPEDRKFAQATPQGSIEMVVDNPLALGTLQPGVQFYIGFTPVVPEPEPVTETAA